MNKITEKLKKELQLNWEIRNTLRDKGDKLSVLADKIWEEGDRLWEESNTIRGRSNDFLHKSDKSWIKTVFELCGDDIKIEWKEGECHLSNGEVFKP